MSERLGRAGWGPPQAGGLRGPGSTMSSLAGRAGVPRARLGWVCWGPLRAAGLGGLGSSASGWAGVPALPCVCSCWSRGSQRAAVPVQPLAQRASGGFGGVPGRGGLSARAGPLIPCRIPGSQPPNPCPAGGAPRAQQHRGGKPVGTHLVPISSTCCVEPGSRNGAGRNEPEIPSASD